MFKKVDVPFDLYEVEVIDASDQELLEISSRMGLGLNLYEMKIIQEYFKRKERNPYDIELQSLAQAWSEHCCYKSSKYYLRQYLFDASKARYVISSIKEDAGVVEFDDEHAYVIKIESHNHPSAIEPYGGAATGIGGIIRDVLCMGAKPIALVDPLFFAPLDTEFEKIPKGTKHPIYLLNGVVSGIRDYGNRVGIPTVAGQVFFDENYLTNCIVNVGCIGIAKKGKILPSKVGGVGDVFILAGGKTGRDGIHGVTFASAELHEKSEEEARGAVQLGNPITKEPLIHSCLEIAEKGLATGMKDLGGGGLSCVVGEMSYATGVGAEIYLEKVPLKEEGMAPWEIWVSESQERMMITAKPENADEILYIFQKWDVPATIVGKSIQEKVLRIYYKGYKVYELDLDFLVKAVEYCRPYKVKKPKIVREEELVLKDFRETFIKMISHPNVASKEWVIRQYDHEVKASTILKPLQGKYNSETHGDAAVLKPTKSYRGIAVTSAVNPWKCKVDPFWGTASSFDEMVRNLVSVNSIPHSFVDCLNFGNPEKPERMGEFVECVRAIGWMAKGYKLPCVSGKVSFYNETPYMSVPPTPTLMGVGIVEDVRKVVSSYFKGGAVILIGETKMEFGGSLYANVTGSKCWKVSKTTPKRLRIYAEAMLEAYKNFKIRSCHDPSEGGLAIALAEMSFGEKIGFKALRKLDLVELFSESNTRWIVEVSEKDVDKVLEFFKIRGLKAELIGYSEGYELDFGSFKVEIDLAEKCWREGMSKFLV
ncbi:MAG: phosphoribosylformylglycinamidine synthase subunit PurL [Archaeoglobaceae archaeon]|nr:phosphoribosylformylglycinamidine synthase subunit PurL [Archaeoglobaceae archaeon]